MGRTKQRRIQRGRDEIDSRPAPSYYPPEALLERADELVGALNFDLARKFVERVLERRANDPRALELLATIELEVGESDAAKEHLLTALATCTAAGESPTSSLHLYLAQLADSPMEALEHFAAGLKLLQAKLEAMPGAAVNGAAQANGKGPRWSDDEAETRRSASRALVGMTELYLTDLCFEDGAEQRCEEYLQLALTLDPTDPEVLQTLASVRLSQQRDADARHCLARSHALWRELDPTDPLQSANIPPFESRLALATLMVETRQLSDAIEVLTGLEHIDDGDVQLFYLRGLAWCLLLEAAQGGAEIAPVFGLPDDLDVAEAGTEARGALERCKDLLARDDAPDEQDVAMGTHVDELLAKLIAAGVPAPAVEDAAPANGTADDGWEDESDDEEDEATMQQ